MKNSDVRLHRLFKAARLATTSATTAPTAMNLDGAAEMPAHLKTRILARWRAGAGVDDLGQMLVGLFRRALVCGAVAMAITFAWSYGELTQEPQNYEDIANYDFRAEEMP
jgi:hypothetical protein